MWAELLAWNQRALAAAQSIGNEALVGGLLNDIGLCYRHLNQYAVGLGLLAQAEILLAETENLDAIIMTSRINCAGHVVL